MNLLFSIAGLILLIGIPVYLHAVIKLGDIVQAEHPEWVSRPGSVSLFSGMLRVANPNVGIAVLGVALGSRWRSLSSSFVSTYVRRIRILLFFLLPVFGGALAAIIMFKP